VVGEYEEEVEEEEAWDKRRGRETGIEEEEGK
jgi:hypothetical protein